MAEVIIELDDGCTLRSDSTTMEAGDYVRLCDNDGKEVEYWDHQEWVEEPIAVMGAIINIMAGVRRPSMQET